MNISIVFIRNIKCFYFQELELELECFIVRIINTHKFSFHWHIIIKQLDVKNNYYIVTLTQIKRTGKKEEKKKERKTSTINLFAKYSSEYLQVGYPYLK